jgi:NAD(P)-dependent dehydrogenase (short-subunit alcohol dehydrogenase family)
MTDINHDNKICLVTGASSGIGAATAKALVQRGATVVGVARGAVTIDGVQSLTADLALLDDVRKLAEKVRSRHGRIDVLINNAGVAKFRRELTADGFERTFATNHLGPFLLTNLLKEALAGGRVITVSSSGHRQVKSLDWDSLPTGDAFRSLATYNVTKLLNVLFTAELARRGATANCADPGFVRTNLGREATGGFGLFLKAAAVFQTGPGKGAHTSVQLACADEVPTGRYFVNSKIKSPSPLAQDTAAARRLWDLSAELTETVGAGW